MVEEEPSSEDRTLPSGVFKTFLYLVFLTLVSFRLNGHDFGGGDHPLHLPVAFQIVRPELYPGDQLVAGVRTYPSVLWKGFALVLSFTRDRLLGAAQAWELGLFLLNRILLLWGLLRLGRLLTSSSLASWMVPAIAIPFNVVPWGGTNFFETGLETSSVGLMLAVHATVLLLEKKYLAWGVVMGLGGAIHPMVALHAAIPMGLWLLLHKEILREKFLWIGAFEALLLSLALLIAAKAFPASVSQIPTEDWMALVRLRLRHHLFPLSWSWRMWAAMAAVLGGAVAGWTFLRRDHPLRKPAAVWFACGALFSVANIFFGEICPVPALLRAHLWREWLIVMPFIFALCAEGVSIWFPSKVQNPPRRQLVLLGLAAFLILYEYRPSQFTATQLASRRNFRDVGISVFQSTPYNAMILSPPDQTGMRLWSLRSVYVEWKDGSALLWDPKWTRDVWLARLIKLGFDPATTNPRDVSTALAKAYDALSSETVKRLAEEEGIGYVLSRHEMKGLKGERLGGGYWLTQVPK